MRAKRGPESLSEVQQMWTKAFPDARIDAVHPLVLSGFAGGVSGPDPPPCLATRATHPHLSKTLLYINPQTPC